MSLMAPILEPERHEDALWITHRTPQSESMLAGERVVFVSPVEARDWMTVLRRTPGVLTTMRRHRVDRVYSTGAALALSALPLAPLVRVKPAFIESLARSAGPSVAGRVLARVPWVDCFTQYPSNVDRRWQYRYSLLDTFHVSDGGAARSPERVFVTLGTARPWQFRRLVERVLEIVPASCSVVWQTGVTATADLPIDARPVMSDSDFQKEIERADVVVSHAGVGSFMRCLGAGKIPVLVPRRPQFGEHVDDHQEQIARIGSDRGLAIMREADTLTFDDLVLASTKRAVRAAG
jgi:UDP-N-acetylglucosamine--N-acetylmuramyl-(pentapeptide) pyrophosphoryl-undecaprenol N-acetylglucosamine transferase